MINCKPKCLAIPLIHNSAYLKYPQKKQNMNKLLLNFFLQEQNLEIKLFCPR